MCLLRCSRNATGDFVSSRFAGRLSDTCRSGVGIGLLAQCLGRIRPFFANVFRQLDFAWKLWEICLRQRTDRMMTRNVSGKNGGLWQRLRILPLRPGESGFFWNGEGKSGYFFYAAKSAAGEGASRRFFVFWANRGFSDIIFPRYAAGRNRESRRQALIEKPSGKIFARGQNKIGSVLSVRPRHWWSFRRARLKRQIRH